MELPEMAWTSVISVKKADARASSRIRAIILWDNWACFTVACPAQMLFHDWLHGKGPEEHARQATKIHSYEVTPCIYESSTESRKDPN